MGRSRYKIYEPTYPHFITCTLLNWIPLFTNQESVEIILSSLQHLQKSDNMKIYSYVILENHLHLIASSDYIHKTMQKFKSFTAKELLKLLQQRNITTILEQLAFYKKAHKTQTEYQVWQEGIHAKLISSEGMMIEKINYMHNNPIKRGYVDEASHWRHSSARDYEGVSGLLEVERIW
ncbi:MAG: transposase [Campylobacterales bacterium]|nr:transposase [Campylobacterales bacterium]